MITVFHGEDILSSRNAYIKEREGVKNPLIFDGENTTVNELTQALEGGNLFGEEKNIFIENLLRKKKSKEQEDILALLKRNEKNSNIFIWEEKEAPRTFFASFKNPSINFYPFPKTLFMFLESLRPGNTSQSLKFLAETRKGMADELLLYMLERQFRLLLSSGTTGRKIDEAQRLAPWQEDRLLRQKSSIGEEKVLSLHKSLFEIELNTKTGLSPAPLPQAIDFFVLEI